MSKTNLSIFARFTSHIVYIVLWKRLTCGANRIQGGLLSAILVSELVAVAPLANAIKTRLFITSLVVPDLSSLTKRGGFNVIHQAAPLRPWRLISTSLCALLVRDFLYINSTGISQCLYARRSKHPLGFYRATACNATHGIAVAILSVCLSVCLYARLKRVIVTPVVYPRFLNFFTLTFRALGTHCHDLGDDS